MTLLLDTSGMFAAFDPLQRGHTACAEVLAATQEALVLSPFVLAELDYMILTHGTVDQELALLASVGAGAYDLAPMTAADVARAHELAARHRDLEIGLADASIVVLSQRYDTADVLTLDQRHFRVLEAAGGRPFRILPADA